MDTLNNIKIEFPTATELDEPKESFIIACIGAFRTLKQGSTDFKRYQKYTVPFISKYKNMDYEEFKRQALEELRK